MPSPAFDVGQALDEGRWTAYQKFLVALAALTILFDGIDNQLLGVTIPSLMREWGLSRVAFAPVASLSLFGMMIGGAIAGMGGDRFGRRRALFVSMSVFGVSTLGVAAVNTVRTLAVLRFITGLGLGGAIPNATALAAEYVPRGRRALAVTLTIVCIPLGASLAGLIATPLLPAIGWRGLFIAGGVCPLVIAAALSPILPESPRYLARHRDRWDELAALLRRMGHTLEQSTAFSDAGSSALTRSRVTDLFREGYARDTVLLWIAFFSCLVAIYLGFNWLPSVVAGAGLASVSSTSVGVFNLGGVVGALGGGAVITRYGSRWAMLAMAAGAAAGCVFLSQLPLNVHTSVFTLLAALAFAGGLINALQSTLYALAGHVYPTSVRATGIGAAASFGRSGAVLSGYAGPWALGYGGTPAFFTLMGASVLVTLLALSGVRRHVPR
jgi:AAHS family 4-hydroxybenzoate transporter-like MFS transporter